MGVLVGTSGWHYPHWRGMFFPLDLRSHEYLAFYSRHFSTVEVNSTFYRLPAAETARSWAAATPPGFTFALKASRYITHQKRLKDPGAGVERFSRIASLLGEKLGPILFQLPAGFGVDLRRLAALLDMLPPGGRYAFEFRDPTWFAPEVRGTLADRGAALCLSDAAGATTPLWVTAPFVYLRLHGSAGMYQGRYSEETLRPYATLISEWAKEGRDVFCYFNNDESGYAVENARMLALMTAPGG
jgi:uncharacterized protein YecE (DUF72 family)